MKSVVDVFHRCPLRNERVDDVALAALPGLEAFGVVRDELVVVAEDNLSLDIVDPALRMRSMATRYWVHESVQMCPVGRPGTFVSVSARQAVEGKHEPHLHHRPTARQ